METEPRPIVNNTDRTCPVKLRRAHSTEIGRLLHDGDQDVLCPETCDGWTRETTKVLGVTLPGFFDHIVCQEPVPVINVPVQPEG